MYFIGIDIGSLSTKVALVQDGTFIDSVIDRSSYNFKEVGYALFNRLLDQNNLTKEDISHVMGTGYGRAYHRSRR